jgi:hypothetical protein
MTSAREVLDSIDGTLRGRDRQAVSLLPSHLVPGGP